MDDGSGYDEILKSVQEAQKAITDAETGNKKALTDLKSQTAEFGNRLEGFEGSINELYKKVGRPGAEVSDNDAKERAAARELLEIKHELKIPKKDPDHPFKPTEDEIKTAMIYRKALPAMMATTDHNTLPDEFRKSLTSFAFGSNSFIMAPEISNRVISCIVDPTDLTGLMDSMTISSPSVRFMIDNQRMAVAGWACEASCFANNPQPDLQEGLGEIEIKPETLRYVVCASRDLLEDASINIEQWMIRKVSDGIRTTINQTLVMGDGVGKPIGFLNPNAGIPICDTSVLTPVGQITWQDLVMLKYEIPMEWHMGCTYLMNQRTFALLLTMSDPNGRPMISNFGTMGFSFCGSPIQIVSQMPDVAPGATPVAFGNWKRVYMIVWRKAITMQQDPYSAGFCVLYKFEARVGGGILCPNAARLLRIR